MFIWKPWPLEDHRQATNDYPAVFSNGVQAMVFSTSLSARKIK
jgi:hypothetical protein